MNDQIDRILDTLAGKPPAGAAEGDRVWFGAAGVYTAAYSSTFNGFARLPTVLTESLPCAG